MSNTIHRKHARLGSLYHKSIILHHFACWSCSERIEQKNDFRNTGAEGGRFVIVEFTPGQ